MNRLRRVPTGTWAMLVVALTLPAMWPFLSHEGYWQSHDGHFHLYRLLSLEEAWRQGAFYPRLFPDFAFGYGFSVLHFYGPLTYYVALAIGALLPSPVLAMKLTYALSYPLAALAAWWFARDLWRQEGARGNEGAGLAAAAAYTYLPYHMADVQLRGALAESWAFVWWPLLFWAALRGRLWPLLLALAALVLTHNLSVILVAIPLALWMALLLFRPGWVCPAPVEQGRHPPSAARRMATFRTFALAGGGALLVSAFYWLPVLLESRYVWISQDVGGLGFIDHLAPWREWLAATASYRYMPEQGVAADHPLSWAQVGLLALALLALPARWRDWRGPLLFWWATLLFSLFLLVPASIPLWKGLLFPFGMVQYPWRWLGITGLATALLVGALFAPRSPGRSVPLPLAPPERLLVGLRPLSIALLLWLALSSMQHLPWMPREVAVARHPVQMWEEDAAVGQVGATWTAEFLPKTVVEQRWALARAPEQVTDVGSRTALHALAAGSDRFTLWVEVEAAQSGWLIFPRYAYPSMRATVDGQPATIEPRGRLGLAGVQVPTGRHLVRLAAYPLASRPWLAALLWLPPAGLLLYLLFRLARHPRGRWLLLLLPVLVLLLSARPTLPLLQARSRLGEQAQLLAARIDSPVEAGKLLQVTLLWFNLTRTDEHYSTFIHLAPVGGGAPVAQQDSEPNMGTAPTPRWLPGQLVEDLHLVPLPDSLAPGEYELWAGMYRIVEGQVLPVPGDSGERRLLGTIEVR